MAKSKPAQQEKPENLLELIPLRRVEWTEENALVILLIPKFRNAVLVRFILARMKNKNFKVKLDEFGSFVWRQMDGQKTVMQIAQFLQRQYGEKVEPVYDRLGLFINLMARRQFISLKRAGGMGFFKKQ